MSWLKGLFDFGLGLAIVSGGLLLGSRAWIVAHTNDRIYSLNAPPPGQAPMAAIVFGAALTRDGRPTAVLRDRVATAVRLYQAGRVNLLVMSGGEFPARSYNEPRAMAAYAEEMGVPPAAIVLDPGGRSTYESCYRAATIFGLEQAILVTQPFHLPRAIYLCDALGIQARGVAAELGRYRRSTHLIWDLRELLAGANALVQIHLKPNPARIPPLEAR